MTRVPPCRIVALGRDPETDNPLKVILKIERQCPLEVLPSRLKFHTYEDSLPGKLKRRLFFTTRFWRINAVAVCEAYQPLAPTAAGGSALDRLTVLRRIGRVKKRQQAQIMGLLSVIMQIQALLLCRKRA